MPGRSSVTRRCSTTRGFAANIVGRSAARLAKGDSLAGPLLENYVLSEIARLLPFAEVRPRLLHFRTKDGIEVDGVLDALPELARFCGEGGADLAELGFDPAEPVFECRGGRPV